jgi:hypothetical protein
VAGIIQKINKKTLQNEQTRYVVTFRLDFGAYQFSRADLASSARRGAGFPWGGA